VFSRNNFGCHQQQEASRDRLAPCWRTQTLTLLSPAIALKCSSGGELKRRGSLAVRIGTRVVARLPALDQDAVAGFWHAVVPRSASTLQVDKIRTREMNRIIITSRLVNHLQLVLVPTYCLYWQLALTASWPNSKGYLLCSIWISLSTIRLCMRLPWRRKTRQPATGRIP
jgi:hypothetical protein